jgi:hypothetical protein
MRERVRLWQQLLAEDPATASRVCDLIVSSQPVRQRLLDRLSRTTRAELIYATRAERSTLGRRYL